VVKRKNKITYIILILLIIEIIMLFQLLNSQQNFINVNETEYLHDIYTIEKASNTDINDYLTRMDINEVIKELGVSNIIPFFNQYTQDPHVSITIIQEALEYNIPVNIAFSIAWRESQFNSNAISPKNRNGSRDWGLFQLNDTYYKWTHDDFFNIEKNVQAGVAHFEYCLEEMGDVPSALAAYNAGVFGIKTYGIPSSTEKHVAIILEYEDELNKEFNKYVKTRGL
jgi:hypothetical protein